MATPVVRSVQRVTRAKHPAPLTSNSPYRQQQAIKRHWDFSKKTKAGKTNRKEAANKIKALRKKPVGKANLSVGVSYHTSKAKKLGHTYY